LEEELNQLMSEKNKNEQFAKNSFEQRVKETKRKAIEDNIKNAEKTGNVLTQTIDNDGNLVGVQHSSNTQENILREMAAAAGNNETNDNSISVSDIRRELFEGDNIVVGKSDYGQSELLSGPFAKAALAAAVEGSDDYKA
jgi:ribosomal protein L18E